MGDKTTQYNLPKKWVKYLITQPETAMGCQIVDIYFKGKTLENVVILNGETFEADYKKLNLSKIEKIVVKEREDLKEIKKFQTVSVKKTPTKEEKMAKGKRKAEGYYLIEEYTTHDETDNFYGGWGETTYDVRRYGTLEQLKEAFLTGPRHDGRLIPAKGLELKLQLIEDDQEDLREALRQDTKRREEAYRRTGDIIDDFVGIT